jgi:DNA polymerase
MQAWLCTLGVGMSSLDEEAVDERLKEDDKACAANASPNGVRDDFQVRALPDAARRALEIRKLVGSAAVKKVYSMRLQMTSAGRLHDLFTFYGARTGRTTGNGPQPTNLPNSGPEVMRCGCGKHYGVHLKACPWCAFPAPPNRKPVEWNEDAVEDALQVIAARDLRTVEYFFGSALAVVSGCLRGLFCAAPGHDLIVSDYSAIEAVVLAMIAGEQWRIDVFRTHGKIYEQSAAKISGTSFEDFMKAAGYTPEELAAPDWYTRKPAAPTGRHHPLRKTIGKVAELASGYQGWIGSWKAFGADEFMTDEEMKDAILAWREASPAIVEFWGGQSKRRNGWNQPELFGVEGMFIAAIQAPGVQFEFRGFKFLYAHDILHLTLLSGRDLHYHRPRLRPSDKRSGEVSISYEGNNTNPKNGPVGFIRMDTWGGRLTENIVQATARDLQWFGMLGLERAGYPIVLHVYDEDVAEVPEGFGQVQEFEKIMATMPAWAQGWPIKASGGFRSKRYRK